MDDLPPPLLEVDADRIRALVRAYLRENNLRSSELTTDAGQHLGNDTNVARLTAAESATLTGRWDDVEALLQSPTPAPRVIFAVRRQRFLEACAGLDRPGAMASPLGLLPPAPARAVDRSLSELLDLLRRTEPVAPSRAEYAMLSSALTTSDGLASHPAFGEDWPRARHRLWEDVVRPALALQPAAQVAADQPPPGQLARLLGQAAAARLLARAAEDARLLAAVPHRVVFDPLQNVDIGGNRPSVLPLPFADDAADGGLKRKRAVEATTLQSRIADWILRADVRVIDKADKAPSALAGYAQLTRDAPAEHTEALPSQLRFADDVSVVSPASSPTHGASAGGSGVATAITVPGTASDVPHGRRHFSFTQQQSTLQLAPLQVNVEGDRDAQRLPTPPQRHRPTLPPLERNNSAAAARSGSPPTRIRTQQSSEQLVSLLLQPSPKTPRHFDRVQPDRADEPKASAAHAEQPAGVPSAPSDHLPAFSVEGQPQGGHSAGLALGGDNRRGVAVVGDVDSSSDSAADSSSTPGAAAMPAGLAPQHRPSQRQRVHENTQGGDSATRTVNWETSVTNVAETVVPDKLWLTTAAAASANVQQPRPAVAPRLVSALVRRKINSSVVLGDDVDAFRDALLFAARAPPATVSSPRLSSAPAPRPAEEERRPSARGRSEAWTYASPPSAAAAAGAAAGAAATTQSEAVPAVTPGAAQFERRRRASRGEQQNQLSGSTRTPKQLDQPDSEQYHDAAAPRNHIGGLPLAMRSARTSTSRRRPSRSPGPRYEDGHAVVGTLLYPDDSAQFIGVDGEVVAPGDAAGLHRRFNLPPRIPRQPFHVSLPPTPRLTPRHTAVQASSGMGTPSGSRRAASGVAAGGMAHISAANNALIAATATTRMVAPASLSVGESADLHSMPSNMSQHARSTQWAASVAWDVEIDAQADGGTVFELSANSQASMLQHDVARLSRSSADNSDVRTSASRSQPTRRSTDVDVPETHPAVDWMASSSALERSDIAATGIQRPVIAIDSRSAAPAAASAASSGAVFTDSNGLKAALSTAHSETARDGGGDTPSRIDACVEAYFNTIGETSTPPPVAANGDVPQEADAVRGSPVHHAVDTSAASRTSTPEETSVVRPTARAKSQATESSLRGILTTSVTTTPTVTSAAPSYVNPIELIALSSLEHWALADSPRSVASHELPRPIPAGANYTPAPLVPRQVALTAELQMMATPSVDAANRRNDVPTSMPTTQLPEPSVASVPAAVHDLVVRGSTEYVSTQPVSTSSSGDAVRTKSSAGVATPKSIRSAQHAEGVRGGEVARGRGDGDTTPLRHAQRSPTRLVADLSQLHLRPQQLPSPPKQPHAMAAPSTTPSRRVIPAAHTPTTASHSASVSRPSAASYPRSPPDAATHYNINMQPDSRAPSSRTAPPAPQLRPPPPPQDPDGHRPISALPPSVVPAEDSVSTGLELHVARPSPAATAYDRRQRQHRPVVAAPGMRSSPPSRGQQRQQQQYHDNIAMGLKPRPFVPTSTLTSSPMYAAPKAPPAASTSSTVTDWRPSAQVAVPVPTPPQQHTPSLRRLPRGSPAAAASDVTQGINNSTVAAVPRVTAPGIASDTNAGRVDVGDRFNVYRSSGWPEDNDRSRGDALQLADISYNLPSRGGRSNRGSDARSSRVIDLLGSLSLRRNGQWNDAQPVRAVAFAPDAVGHIESSMDVEAVRSSTVVVGTNSRALRILRTRPGTDWLDAGDRGESSLQPVVSWAAHHLGSIYAVDWWDGGSGAGRDVPREGEDAEEEPIMRSLIATVSNDATLKVVQYHPGAPPLNSVPAAVALSPGVGTLRAVLWLADQVSSTSRTTPPLLACAGGGDYAISIYDLAEGRYAGPLARLHGHENTVTGLCLWRGAGASGMSPPHLLSSSADGTARLWDVRQQRAASVFSITAPPASASFYGGTNSVVSWSSGSRVAARGAVLPVQCIATGGTPGDALASVFVVGTADGSVAAVDVVSGGRTVASARVHGDEVRCVRVAATAAICGSSFILSASSDGTLRASAVAPDDGVAWRGGAGLGDGRFVEGHRSGHGVVAQSGGLASAELLTTHNERPHADKTLCVAWKAPHAAGLGSVASSSADRSAVVWSLQRRAQGDFSD